MCILTQISTQSTLEPKEESELYHRSLLNSINKKAQQFLPHLIYFGAQKWKKQQTPKTLSFSNQTRNLVHQIVEGFSKTQNLQIQHTWNFDYEFQKKFEL